MIPVRTFTDPAALTAHYAAVRARLNPRKPTLVVLPQPPKPEPEPEPEPVKPTAAEIEATIRHANRERAKAKINNQRAYARALIDAVAKEHGERAADLIGTGMYGSMSRARREAIVAIAQETSLTLSDIARLMSKDHTSVIYAIRVHNDATGSNLRNLGGLPRNRTRKGGDKC